jgi:hypothetical protein
MLKFDTKKKMFDEVQEAELKAEHILERYDLQEAIATCWELFKNELGLPNAFLVGQEVTPDEVTQGSIDLLAYDSDDSSLIVIELKRDKHKLQLLQALSYAAIVNRWDVESLISKIQSKYNPELEELQDLIRGSELASDVKVILIAEKFDPEVILTADWLSTNYSVNISAFSISLFTMGDTRFLSLDQKYPLKELQESYVARPGKKRARKPLDEIEWEDVIPKLQYPFARRGIELCQKIKPGEPGRRRFGTIRKKIDGFNWVSVNFRTKYINVYLCGQFEGNEDVLRSKFRDNLDISSWKDGVSCKVSTERQFEDLVRWLKLE